MGYSALLFCPDDKTARTVTQVLSELEFSVETCAEPFAAVKKLMGEHFDALVVDCDNEQNATLLFKSARNSTSNQASLAVAVVEGQAGVAKAFRIGANLVLTKPINVEQAKGTLRVARGLLRKGEPGKPAAAPQPPTAATPAATPAKAAPPKPVAPARPVASTAVAAPKPPASLPPKPVPSVPPPAPVPVASAPHAVDEDLFEISREGPSIAPPVSIHSAPVAEALQAIPPAAEAKTVAKPASASSSFGSAAASAPAPAREVPKEAPAEVPAVSKEAPTAQSTSSNSVADALFEKPAEPVQVAQPAPEVTPPSFTFGGSNQEESSGGSKKILIGVAAAMIVAIGGYFAWSHFQGGPSSAPTAATPPSAVTQPAKPAEPVPTKPSGTASASTSKPAEPPVAESSAPSDSKAVDDSQPLPENESALSNSTKASSSKPSSKSEEAPLLVKRGAAPAHQMAAAVPDAPAPSMIGMGAPSGGAALPNLGGSSAVAKPVLQTLNISQGVSSGLLIKKVQPSYPQNAMAMHVEGAVELLATISKTGNISNIKVLSGPPLLTRAASDAVKQWKYAPYLLNGEPVEIQTQITINFKLPR